MQRIFKPTILIFFISGLIACGEQSVNNRLLTKASSKVGELILVMDSIQWKGPLGTALRKTLMSETPGLPRPEPLFIVRYIEPTLFNSVLNKARNIIFVATLDSQTKGGQIVRNYMTKNYIQTHPDKFAISQKDVYAKGQNILYLFSSNKDILTQRIYKNKAMIRDFFDQKEKQYLLSELYAAKEKKGINNDMLNKHGFRIRVPNGFRIEEDRGTFFWVRSVGKIDKNIFISYQPYHSEEVFKKQNLIALRDSITHIHIFEDPADPDSYIVSDTINVRTEYRKITFDNKYGVELKGIWRSNTFGIGGPYVSVSFVDKSTNRLYYIEGFVISPGVNKRDTMRELETIIDTFRTREELKNSGTSG